MATGKKVTKHYPNYDAIEAVAAEENLKLNGSDIEDIVWEKFAGSDPEYSRIIRSMYEGKIDLRKCLESITELQAYNDEFRSKNNLDFIKVVGDAIGSSNWVDNDEYVGDYSLARREVFIDNLSNIYGTLIREITNRNELAERPMNKQNGIKPWQFPVQDARYKSILTKHSSYEPMYLNELELKRQNYLSMIEQCKRPGEIIKIIMNEWDYFWPFAATYEAIEFCICLAQNITDKTPIRKQLREFGIKVGFERKIQEIYLKKASEKIPSVASLSRILLYAEKIKELSEE